MKTILVAGAMANKPGNAGNAWSRLSWVLGLQRLGYKVCFLEQIDRKNCVDEHGNSISPEQSVNRLFFQSVMREFGFEDAASLLCEDGECAQGMAYSDLLAM